MFVEVFLLLFLRWRLKEVTPTPSHWANFAPGNERELFPKEIKANRWQNALKKRGQRRPRCIKRALESVLLLKEGNCFWGVDITQRPIPHEHP